MPILTNKSLYILAIASIILLPSINYPIFLIAFYLFIAVILFLIIIDYIAIRVNLKIDIRRHAENQLSLLDTNLVEMEIAYRGKIPLNLQIMESGLEKFFLDPAKIKIKLMPQSRIALNYKLTPTTRGDFTFEAIHVRTTSTLGFVILQRRYFLPQPVRVVPSIKAIKKYNLLSKHPHLLAGEKVFQTKGQSLNFKELRDYISGDEYRNIDWKVSAKRDKLTVREYDDERCQNLMIMIDTGRLMTSFVPRGKKEGASLLETDIQNDSLLPWENPLRETTRLDFTINAALVLSYVAISKGDYVGLMAFSDREDLFVPSRSGKGQIKVLVNTLYKLSPRLVESDYLAAITKVAAVQRKRALMIFFTDLIDPEASKNLIKYLLALHPRHSVLVVVFRDAEIASQAEKKASDNRELFDISIARDLMYQRELALHELRRGGAMTLDLYPEELSVQVVNEYLRLKSSSAL